MANYVCVIYDDLEKAIETIDNINERIDDTVSKIVEIRDDLEEINEKHGAFTTTLENLNKLTTNFNNYKSAMEYLRTQCESTVKAFKDTENKNEEEAKKQLDEWISIIKGFSSGDISIDDVKAYTRKEFDELSKDDELRKYIGDSANAHVSKDIFQSVLDKVTDGKTGAKEGEESETIVDENDKDTSKDGGNSGTSTTGTNSTGTSTSGTNSTGTSTSGTTSSGRTSSSNNNSSNTKSTDKDDTTGDDQINKAKTTDSDGNKKTNTSNTSENDDDELVDVKEKTNNNSQTSSDKTTSTNEPSTSSTSTSSTTSSSTTSSSYGKSTDTSSTTQRPSAGTPSSTSESQSTTPTEPQAPPQPQAPPEPQAPTETQQTPPAPPANNNQHTGANYTENNGYQPSYESENGIETPEPVLETDQTPPPTPTQPEQIQNTETSVENVVQGNKYSKIPTSSEVITPSAPTKSSGGNSFIPITAGLSAAAAAGIGAKAFIDRKNNNNNDNDILEEGNWDEEDSIEINADDATKNDNSTDINIADSIMKEDILNDEDIYSYNSEKTEKYGAKNNEELADLQ